MFLQTTGDSSSGLAFEQQTLLATVLAEVAADTFAAVALVLVELDRKVWRRMPEEQLLDAVAPVRRGTDKQHLDCMRSQPVSVLGSVCKQGPRRCQSWLLQGPAKEFDFADID